MQYSISLIGAGNVAWHLAQALENAGHQIREVYSRRVQQAEGLANKLYDAQVVATLDFSGSAATVFLLCVPDDALTAVVEQIILPDNEAILCHTSGTQPGEILLGYPNTGVFYPLQTFSKSRRLDVSTTPFCIEASNSQTEKILVEIAQSISQTVYLVSAQERKVLHIGAVFACNFTNHLLAIAKEILDREDLEFDLLKPLIKETFEKALTAPDPNLVQTGPAARGDYQTLQSHLAYLQDQRNKKAIYESVTENILQMAGKKKNE